MIKSKNIWRAAVIAMAFWLPSHFAAANALVNGSFEDTSAWTVSGFHRLNSFTDKSGIGHLPTDGNWMMGVTIPTPAPNVGGKISQAFVLPASTSTITFDRNLIDPIFGTNDPLKALLINVYLRETSGMIWSKSTLPAPTAANRWEPISLKLGGIAGNKYNLLIEVVPSYDGVICVTTPCPGIFGSGTLLVDNVVVAPADPSIGPAPTITGFWPGTVKPGSMVFVFGSNYVPRATKIAVNGVSAPIVQVIDQSLLVFMLPAGVTSGPITVATAAGSATSRNDFGVPLTGLQVTSFWPSEAKVFSPVIVFGSGFERGAGMTKMSINGLAVPIVQVVDPSLLFMLVPPGATSGPVTAEVNGQTATSGTSLTILP